MLSKVVRIFSLATLLVSCVSSSGYVVEKNKMARPYWLSGSSEMLRDNNSGSLIQYTQWHSEKSLEQSILDAEAQALERAKIAIFRRVKDGVQSRIGTLSGEELSLLNGVTDETMSLVTIQKSLVADIYYEKFAASDIGSPQHYQVYILCRISPELEDKLSFGIKGALSKSASKRLVKFTSLFQESVL